MKNSYLILFFLASFVSIKNVTAQANVQATGISIQGIARDENNSALANIDQLGLTFTIYYLNASNTEVTILNQAASVKTDNFGVFSYVMNIDNGLFTAISNSQAYLKVMQGTTVFSNEKLQAVPYAIQAQNGVPSGTIMAYIGTTAPVGWLMCNGASFPDEVSYAKLKALLGSTNTPDLSGRFLRGTGSAGGDANKSGPALKSFQGDANLSHAHGVGSFSLSTNGEHNHNNGGYNSLLYVDGKATAASVDVTAGQPNLESAGAMLDAGNHTHTISGSSASSGETESRPVNYGVNYIIKI